MNNLAADTKYNKQLEKLRTIYDAEVEKWKKEKLRDMLMKFMTNCSIEACLGVKRWFNET